MTRGAILVRIGAVRLVHAVARLLPVRDRIVLATAHSAVLRGNLAAIRGELSRRDDAPSVVVLASRPRRGIRGAVGVVMSSMVGAFYLATSRLFIVDDYYFPIYVVRRRSGTTVVQAWHAAGAFKKMGYSLTGKGFGGGAALLDLVAIHSNYDLCLISSATVATHYAEAFRLPLDRFVSTIGLPRTDVLFGAAATTAAARVREQYRLPADRKVVLYAPTFRGESGIDPAAGAFLDLQVLRRSLGADHVVLLRLHPFVRGATAIDPDLGGFVIDVSAYPEINDLMLVSDVLVTDYSSAIFEFALLGRPIVFFAPDLGTYEKERGFYFDYRTGVPGPVVETSEEVAEHIRAGAFDPARVREFAAAAFDVADGRAAERFVARIAMPLLDRERRDRG